MISMLTLENPKRTIKRVQSLYNSCKLGNLSICRSLELKHIFNPHLDNKEIVNSWFKELSKGETLPFHRDTEVANTYLFYLQSKGTSPLVVGTTLLYPKTGDFLTFPSYVRHSVPIVRDCIRVSLAIETSNILLTSIDYERYA